MYVLIGSGIGRGRGDGSNRLGVSRTFGAIHVRLSECFVCRGIGEIIRAIGRAVGHEETAALEAAFVVKEELAFGRSKFGSTGAGNIRVGSRGGQGVRKGVRATGGFSECVGAAIGLPRGLGDALKLLTIRSEAIVNAFHLRYPFLEIGDLIYFLRVHFLR
jgi:hypothetical protein